MWEKIKTFKGYVFLFLLFCAVSGGLFGVIVTNDWHNVSITNLFPEPTVSKAVLIVFSIFAYLMQGIAFGLVYERREHAAYKTANFLFFTQFVLGIFWLFLFFTIQSMGFAAFDLFAVVMLLMATYAKFKEISTIAAWLLLPYALQIAALGIISGYFYVI